MRSIVSIVRCETYAIDEVRHAVRTALELAEIESLVSDGKRVLLKPNLLSTRDPDQAVTTHPSIMRALGEIALEQGASVTLGDSPPFAGENPVKYAKLCERTGAADVAKDMGIELVRFEEDIKSIFNPDGRIYKSFDIAHAVSEADVLVNIPKMKTHGLAIFSGAVKNIFGCIPGIRKGLFHAQAAEDRATFAQMLIDLLGAIRPPINVMDAIMAMEGEGPNAGSPRHIGVILASADPVALDAVACSIAGIDPMTVDTTRLASEQGLGYGNIEQIELRGANLDSLKLNDFKLSSGRNDWANIPLPIRQALRKQLVAFPHFLKRECIGCMDCVKVCPVNALTPRIPPKVDLEKCVRCYCCHEVCNPHAINLKRGLIGEILFKLWRKR